MTFNEIILQTLVQYLIARPEPNHAIICHGVVRGHPGIQEYNTGRSKSTSTCLQASVFGMTSAGRMISHLYQIFKDPHLFRSSHRYV